MSVYLDGSSYLSLNSVPITAYPYTILIRYKSDDLVTTEQVLHSVANGGVNNKFFNTIFRPAEPLVKHTRCNNFAPISNTSITHDTMDDALFVGVAIVATSGTNVLASGGNVSNVNSFIGQMNAGIQDTTDNTIASLGFTRMLIGASGELGLFDKFKGWVAELTVLNVALTTAQINDYLAGMEPQYIPGISVPSIVFYGSFATSLTPEIKTGTLTNVGGTLATSVHPDIIRYTPVSYNSVPDFYVDPTEYAAFRNALFFSGSDVLMFGDSTRTEAGAGRIECNWIDELLYGLIGARKATSWTTSNSSIGANRSSILYETQNAQAVNADYVDADFPPGFALESQKMFYKGAGGQDGAIIQLNHADDNENTTHALGNDTSNYPFDSGMHDVISAAGTGKTAFSAGTLFGGRSKINCAAGLQLDVIVATSPTGANDCRYNVRPMSRMTTSQTSVAATQTGIINSHPLTAAAGSFFKDSVTLNALNGASQLWYQLQLAGDTTNAAEKIWIPAMRFSSQSDALGLGLSFISHGGYYAVANSSASFMGTHPDCDDFIAQMGMDIAWVCLGTNDSGDVGAAGIAVHPATYSAAIQDIIDRLVAINPSVLIILESPVHHDFVQNNGSFANALLYYGDILYRLAQANANVALLHTYKISANRYGFGGKTSIYLSDGTHRSAAGAEVVAKSAVWYGLATAFGIPIPRGRGAGAMGAAFLLELLERD